ncbi:MAG: ABC transporter permease [Lachnospiraceae bacterium]
MTKYLLKRVGIAILTLLLVTAITYFLMNAIPGSPFLTEKSTPEQIARAEEKYGLDKPIYIQYANYLSDLLHGDLGISLKMQEGISVTQILFTQGKFALSVKLGLIALSIAILVGVTLGCLAAYHRNRLIDNVLRVLTTFGVAIPTFVSASLLLVILSVKLGVLPGVSGSLESAKNYIMPVAALSFYPCCYISKLTRTSMLDTLNQDYIRTARAKGLKTGIIVFKHALRNSLIPVVTYLGPLTAFVLTGGFVVETTFGIPGLGKYLISSILNRDYPIIMGTTIVLATLIIVMNLIVDILYVIIDPRISLAKAEV